MLPPSGGDFNRGQDLVIVTWVFTTLALVIVGLKVYTRIKILREPALDDVFTVLAVILVTICTCLMTASVAAGMGRHLYYLTPSQRMRAVKLNMVATPFGIIAYSLPNISVAIFVNRILCLDKGRKWALFGVVIFQNIAAVISSILVFTQCTEQSDFWGLKADTACVPVPVLIRYSYFVGVYSAATDVLLAIVPIAAFWKLQMRLKNKIGLCLLMSSTMCAAICAIIKTTKVKELQDTKDFTYVAVDLLLWAVAESNAIIIAACVPSLRPFVISISQSVRGGGGGRSKSSLPPHHDEASHSNIKFLAIGPHALAFDAKGMKRMSDVVVSVDSRSDRSLPPENAVRRNSELAVEWDCS